MKSLHLRRVLKILLSIILSLLILVMLLIAFLNTDYGQNWLAKKITGRLSRDLQARIEIKHVSIGFFDRLNMEGVMVEDQFKDTLLYAGKVGVNITDWFFFKDKAEIKYLNLEDAVINLNRRDSIWNYRFLEDYFASPTSSKKKDAGIAFDLKVVALRNVRFNQVDKWAGNNMMVAVKSLDVDAREISLSNKKILIDKVVLSQPVFTQLIYKGLKPKTVKPVDTVKVQQAWEINFGAVTIDNGRFRMDRDSLNARQAWFDDRHMDFSEITGKLNDFGFTADTIRGNMDLKLKERSGIVVKQLKANTIIHPQAMIFDDLTLETNNSKLTHHYSMHYKKMSDLDDFIHAVTLDARFSDATISSDDLAFFAPDTRNWKKVIRIDGDVRGTIDALSSPSLEISAGRNTYVKGAISLLGLPDINSTLINVEKAVFRTNYADATSFIPALRRITVPNLRAVNNIGFNGTFTGFINDFVSYGTITTDLGSLTTDLNMKLPNKGVPVYTGSINTSGFNLGRLLNEPQLGIVAVRGKVQGRGFDINTVDARLNGTVARFDYKQYSYRNITINGHLKQKVFNGDVAMDDPNARLKLSGNINLTGRRPVFSLKGNIDYANLQKLQVTNEPIEVQGAVDVDLSGNALENLLGRGSLQNVVITHGDQRISFDSLNVVAGYVNGLKNLRLSSNEFNGSITGDFDIQALPAAFQLFLHRYYPSIIDRPAQVRDQAFTFDITTGNIQEYLKLIDPNIVGFNNSHITGSLNTSANTMTIDADVPFGGYKDNEFSDIQVKGSGTQDELILTGQVLNGKIGDSLFFPQTNFNVTARGDISDVTINTTANQAINQANLSARVQTFNDGVSIAFNPSTFVLNNKTWTIEQGGELNFRRNRLPQGEVVLRESNQEIRLYTRLSEIGAGNDLHASFKNINIGDFSPFLTRAYRIEGNFNGDVVIEDVNGRQDAKGDFTITELRLDNDSLGTFKAQMQYSNQTGMLTGTGSNVDPEQHLNFNIAMDLKDPENAFEDKITLNPVNYRLDILEHFLSSIFSDINGYVTGQLDILGEGAARNYTAKAKVRDASFKVAFTQVTYYVYDTEINLTKDKIDLNNIRIHDAKGNNGIIRGYISHNAFKDMFFDVAVVTESRQMELINTTLRDNQQFYGHAWGSGSFVLVGPQDDLLMNIDIKASETDSSYVTLPPSKSFASDQADFLVERKYGREMSEIISKSATSNLTYEVNLTANPMVNVSVVLDELTGDEIKGRGTGTLRITAGTALPMSIVGRYEIEAGSYAFTFQSLFKKPFVLRSNANNYIDWDGDPYAAKIHLEAVYTANEVSFAPLATTLLTSSATGGSVDLSRLRDDVNVVATLTGDLFRPNFEFQLEFPSNNVIYSNPAFTFGIQQIEKNQNELNKQVAYLIVFNSFAPFENATNATARPFEEVVSNTLSGLLFGEINKKLNELFGKVLNSNDISFSFTGNLYNRNLIDPNSRSLLGINQSDLNVSFGKSILNQRITFTVGGTFDVPLDPNFQQTLRLLPDVTMRIRVNPTGSLSATFFYRQTADYLLTGATTNPTAQRYGTSLTYGKDIERLGDLFRRRKPIPAAPSPAVSDTTSP